MSGFKKVVIFAAMVLITVAALFAIRRIEYKMDDIINEKRLRFSGDVRNAPPAVAFTSVALGSFRGLIADILWLRSEGLKAKKSYFEMVQLARWITDLQPNYSGGTAYLAWNLAYNISVTTSDYEDRWRWVNEGISLIRDKALLYNPDDPVLYKELAWIFYHKLGNTMDDAHLTYKKNLGEQMIAILGVEPDLEAIAAAPDSWKGFLEKHDENSSLMQAVKKAKYANIEAVYDAFKTASPAVLPENLRVVISEHDYRALDSFFRSELLKERMKLDARRMVALDKRYGKFDWRLPETQAIYWATMGIERTPAKRDLQCARLLTQALMSSFRVGRLLTVNGHIPENVPLGPNLALVDSAYQAFIDTQNEYEKNNRYGSFYSARINYTKDAIVLLYTHGNISKAREYFRKLIKEDGPQKQKTLDEFVMVEFAEDVRDSDSTRVTALINELIYRSIMSVVYGDEETAVGMERLARYIHKTYTAKNADVKRNQIPSYKDMKKGVLQACERMFSPAMLTILKTYLAREESEVREGQKNDPSAANREAAGKEGR